jgi:hypothetical protein
MATRIAPRFQAPPAGSVYAPGRVVAGRTPASLVESANHLNGCRFLRDFSLQVDGYALQDYPNDSSIYVDPGAVAKGPVRFLWTVSPYASHVYLGAWHIAAEAAKGGGSGLSMGIYTFPAGVLVAGPWAVSSDRLKTVGVNEPGQRVRGEGYVCTVWGTELLDVSAQRGAAVELRVTPSFVRLYAIDIIEVYAGEFT